jgi:hypothetical protein
VTEEEIIAACKQRLAKFKVPKKVTWTMWRRRLEPMDNGLAAGPEFWKRVHALREKRYYPLPDMEGMPT